MKRTARSPKKAGKRRSAKDQLFDDQHRHDDLTDQQQNDAAHQESATSADNFDGDDDAPEEVPVGKVNFIPLKAGKKRKRVKAENPKSEASTISDAHVKEEQDVPSEDAVPKKSKRNHRFFEVVPGHYVGSKQTKKFRVVDLSSNANVMSSAHKRAVGLKQGMFNRHRRVSGRQLLGQLHKSKMVGKG